MIGISIGDANGVGPEILLRAFREGLIPGEFMAVGDLSALKKYDELLGLRTPIRVLRETSGYHPGVLNLLDTGSLSGEDIAPGRLDREVGRAALGYIRETALRALDREFEAMVTLPVNKEAIRLTSPDFSGHTGYIAALSGTSRYTMMLAAEQLIVTHVSTHVSLREALDLVSKERILEVIRLTRTALEKLRPMARIAVAGLNPHAGEGGAFGREEIEEIAPASHAAREEGLEVSGPIPPDTVFHQALSGRYNAVVCMYHDQGHIPLKLLGFESGVNVTLGLPFVRTSVDHGTAYDIAGRGTASLASFVNACVMARKLAGE